MTISKASSALKAADVEVLSRSRCLNRAMDIVLVLPLILLLLPVTLLNLLIAVAQGEQMTLTHHLRDGFNRPLMLKSFRHGVWRKHLYLYFVGTGRLSLCGVSIFAGTATTSCATSSHQLPCGLFSIVDVHRQIGLEVTDPQRLELAQYQKGIWGYLALILKSIFCRLFYRNTCEGGNVSRSVRVFGLHLHNLDMSAAVDWVVSPIDSTPRVAFFVNAHSVNTAAKRPAFQRYLVEADALFADGSGMRLAVSRAGQRLCGNINGTDMLPPLCKAASALGLSLFFLGAKPGIAKAAADNLVKKHPSLTIAGHQHGYFDKADDTALIEQINRSNADIVLVALGSPHQERWITANKHRLNCRTLLAVGGLFDYFSGAIPRAPQWMRELGLEWVWRLAQEPMTKFKRYVIGTPEFLVRTFIFNQARKGF